MISKLERTVKQLIDPNKQIDDELKILKGKLGEKKKLYFLLKPQLHHKYRAAQEKTELESKNAPTSTTNISIEIKIIYKPLVDM